MGFLFKTLKFTFLSVILSSIDIQFMALGIQRKQDNSEVTKITPLTLILVEPQQRKGNF